MLSQGCSILARLKTILLESGHTREHYLSSRDMHHKQIKLFNKLVVLAMHTLMPSKDRKTKAWSRESSIYSLCTERDIKKAQCDDDKELMSRLDICRHPALVWYARCYVENSALAENMTLNRIDLNLTKNTKSTYRKWIGKNLPDIQKFLDTFLRQKNPQLGQSRSQFISMAELSKMSDLSRMSDLSEL